MFLAAGQSQSFLHARERKKFPRKCPAKRFFSLLTSDLHGARHWPWAEALAERFEQSFWCAELHRLCGVFLATMGAEETKIEASFQAAIRTAKEQKSVSLEKRAEASYAEYHRQKASASGGPGLRLPLW